MKIRLVCLEDGIMSCGFRKMASRVEQLNDDTVVHYVSTNHFGGLRFLLGAMGGAPDFDDDAVNEVAEGLAGADLVGFSSMTGYSAMTKAIAKRLRELSPQTYAIWGGIHPIMHPEDAIAADVDAICTGEGEFAFEHFLENYRAGRDFSETKNFWFKKDGEIQRNDFLPLMSAQDMETLPFPKYGGREWIYKKGHGFVPVTVADYLHTNGLSYNAIWSIGCPFKCTYCGNTKFIANHSGYRKIRHPSAEYCMEEIKAAVRTHPHISCVSFHDDSFLAIQYEELEKFAELWRKEVNLPFAVYGIIPNYVRKDKLEILTWAGMNRARMGIQSGSQRILDFYQRPTPVERVEAAAKVLAEFAPKYQMAPGYDIITDNPIETKQDVVDTLELVYRMARPYALNLFSLKVIPNTVLEKTMREEGVDLEEISSSYRNIPPKLANLLLYLVTIWKPPRWLFDLALEHVDATTTPQREFPRLGLLLRTAFFTKRSLDHLRFMDFSTLQGPSGYIAYKTGLVKAWRKLRPDYPRPAPRPKKQYANAQNGSGTVIPLNRLRQTTSPRQTG